MKTDYTHQVALIVPDAQVEAARNIAEAMGWGPGNYSVELTDGTDMFWGLSSVATQSFVDMMDAAEQGAAFEGVSDDDLDAVLLVLAQSIETTGTRTQAEQFNALCEAQGLARVIAEVE